jgi:hypothetical protein
MKNSLIKIGATIFLISVFSCSQKDSDENNIRYSMKKFERIFTNPDTTLKNYAKVVFEYPEIIKTVNQQVKDSIASYVKGIFLKNYFGKAKSFDEMADSLFKDFNNFQKEFRDSPQSWEIESATSVIYNKNSIVSLQSNTYSYLGGAHPNELVLYANFNSENGKRINLSDLFKDENIPELNTISEKIFRKEKELSAEANLEEAGFWFKENKFALNDNFGIKDDGLMFYFNPYEIAPYSMGPTEILIPYDEIKNIIKEDGLLFEAASRKN